MGFLLPGDGEDVEMNSRLSKCILVFLSSVLLLTTGLQPLYAFDKSRAFICFLFLSGVGSSAAGAIVQGQASEKYDEYMHTAVQTKMDNLIDDYEKKHRQSIVISRTGTGLVVGAILLSLVDIAGMPPPEVQNGQSSLGFESRISDSTTVSTRSENGDYFLSMNRSF